MSIKALSALNENLNRKMAYMQANSAKLISNLNEAHNKIDSLQTDVDTLKSNPPVSRPSNGLLSNSNTSSANHTHPEYALKTEIPTNYASSTHTHSQYALKTEIPAAVNLSNYVLKSELATNYASSTHNHDAVYAKKSDIPTNYAVANHNHIGQYVTLEQFERNRSVPLDIYEFEKQALRTEISNNYSRSDHEHNQYASFGHEHSQYANINHVHNEYLLKTDVNLRHITFIGSATMKTTSEDIPLGSNVQGYFMTDNAKETFDFRIPMTPAWIDEPDCSKIICNTSHADYNVHIMDTNHNKRLRKIMVIYEKDYVQHPFTLELIITNLDSKYAMIDHEHTNYAKLTEVNTLKTDVYTLNEVTTSLRTEINKLKTDINTLISEINALKSTNPIAPSTPEVPPISNDEFYCDIMDINRLEFHDYDYYLPFEENVIISLKYNSWQGVRTFPFIFSTKYIEENSVHVSDQIGILLGDNGDIPIYCTWREGDGEILLKTNDSYIECNLVYIVDAARFHIDSNKDRSEYKLQIKQQLTVINAYYQNTVEPFTEGAIIVLEYDEKVYTCVFKTYNQTNISHESNDFGYNYNSNQPMRLIWNENGNISLYANGNNYSSGRDFKIIKAFIVEAVLK